MRARPLPILLACGALGACGSGDGASSDSGGGLSIDGANSSGPSTEFAFDPGPADRRVRVERVDEDGDGVAEHSTTYEYDDAGRIVSEMKTFGDSAFSQVVTYQYENGRLVTKSDGVDTFTYVYDDGRVIAIEEPEGEGATFEYDEGGRLVSFTETGHDDDEDSGGPGDPFPPDPVLSTETIVVEYEEDLPTRLVFENGGVLRFGRDDDGRLASLEAIEASEVERVQTLTRDERGRIVRIDVLGEFEQSFQAFYAENRLVSMVLVRPRATLPSESRSELEYAPDGLLEIITTVTDLDLPSGAQRTTSVTRFEYESPGCIGQPTNDPRTALIVDALGAQRAPLTALECGYFLDDDF